MNMMMNKAGTQRQTALTDEVVEALNKQIKVEDESSQYYLSCASWCHTEGYEGAADFFYRHAEEEREHMLKIFKYVNEAGGHAMAAEISAPNYHFGSLREVFESVMDHEIHVSKKINTLVDFCFGKKDFMTFQFLLWFVEEQREEEEVARRALELFDIIGEEGQGIWMIDQQLSKLGE